MNVAQIIVIAILGADFGIAVYRIGKKKEGVYKWSDALAPVIWAWLLFLGGFWGQ